MTFNSSLIQPDVLILIAQMSWCKNYEKHWHCHIKYIHNMPFHIPHHKNHLNINIHKYQRLYIMVEFQYLHYLNVNTSSQIDQAVNQCENQEIYEIFLVGYSYTVIDIIAMMVHLKYLYILYSKHTSVASSAMMRSRRLEYYLRTFRTILYHLIVIVSRNLQWTHEPRIRQPCCHQVWNWQQHRHQWYHHYYLTFL